MTWTNTLKKKKKRKKKAKAAASADLILAAWKGDADIVEQLLAKGANVKANPNATDDDGNTALMIAARYGHADIARQLIEAGAIVNTKNNYGWTALTLAYMWGHTSTMKVLEDAGAHWPAIYYSTNSFPRTSRRRRLFRGMDEDERLNVLLDHRIRAAARESERVMFNNIEELLS